VAAGLGRRPGGIRGLLGFLAEHREAVEYDLIALGLRLDWLGSGRLSWRDLLVVIRQAPRNSAVNRAQDPDHAWGLPEQLLAALFDATRVGIWQRGSGKRSDYPEPLERPGVKPPRKKYGGTPLPMHEMAKRLGWDTEGGAA